MVLLTLLPWYCVCAINSIIELYICYSLSLTTLTLSHHVSCPRLALGSGGLAPWDCPLGPLRGQRPPAGGGPRQKHLLRSLSLWSVSVFVVALTIKFTTNYNNVRLPSVCLPTKVLGFLPMATSWHLVPHGIFCLMVFFHPMAALSAPTPRPPRSSPTHPIISK